MTSWRDARLQRALEDAPDREALPDPRTRRAVLDIAHKAVAAPVVATGSWWKKLWPDTGATRMPWNAALATVALATLVTVLWHDEPVPDAAPQGSQADRAAPAKVVPPVVTPSAPVAAPPPAEAPAPKPAADAKVAQRPAPKAIQERRAEASVDALRDSAERSLAKSAPAVAEDRAGGVAAGASTGSARTEGTSARTDSNKGPVAEVVPPPAAAPAAAPRSFARPASPALSAQTAAPGRPEWTHVRIESAGRSVELTREQATTLANLLNSLERSARTQPVLDVPASTRIELRAQGAVLEVIELGGGRARWQDLRGGRSEMVAAQPDPSKLQALQAEVDRLLGR